MRVSEDDKKAQDLISKACKAYGIDKQYVLGSGIDEHGLAVIVTCGGRKVRYREGDKVERLSNTEITGCKERNKESFLQKVLGLQGKTILGSPREGSGVKYPTCDLFDECAEYAKNNGWEEFNCVNCP